MTDLVNFGGQKDRLHGEMGGFEMGPSTRSEWNGRNGQFWEGGKMIVQMPKMGGKTAAHTHDIGM